MALARTTAPRWHGKVSEDGTRVDLFARTLFKRWLMTKAGRFVTLVIEERTRRRTSSQNGYWWGVVVPAFAERCGYLPHEHDAVHDELMRVLVGLRSGGHPVLPIRVSSRDLTTAEFNALIEAAQMFAAEKLNLVIDDPDPEHAFRRKGLEPAHG